MEKDYIRVFIQPVTAYEKKSEKTELGNFLNASWTAKKQTNQTKNTTKTQTNNKKTHRLSREVEQIKLQQEDVFPEDHLD